jgi:signal transduction histidine kinase
MSRSHVLTPEDFRPGAPIVEEFSTAVSNSRLIVIVLTDAFVADEWARFGQVLASHRSVSERPCSIVSVLLEPCQVPPHVDFRVCLDCTDHHNWAAELRRLRELLRRPEPRDEPPTCPYPGMRPFRQDEAHLFHGRESEVAEMAHRLRHQGFLFVIGPSGVGKSSLVYAGVVPLLRTKDDWVIRHLRPGARPLESLARALTGTADGLSVIDERVEAVLRDRPADVRLLLIVDQLEEAFVEVGDDERRSFLSTLSHLCRHPRCVPIITMRADFYPDLMTSEMWTLARDARVEVTPLHRDHLREAIVRPAATVGVYLQPALTERLLADAAEEPGVLPFVQEAMVLLWDQREHRLLTLRSYERLGGDQRSGLAAAIAVVADGALTDLSDAERRVARRILLRLVQFGEGRNDTRRQQSVAALRAPAETPELFDATVLHLARRRVLTLSGQEDEDIDARKVDLAHESLITGWTTLRRWLEEDREGLRLQRQLERDAEEWQRFGRDSGVLYRGVRLQAAGEWMDQHPGDVTELERAFVVASRAEAASQRIPSVASSPWQEALTEADLVQLLYAELHPVFGYDSINLQVLEREGWYHSWAIDHGVLQDVRRRPLSDSYFASAYQELRPLVMETSPSDQFPPTRSPRPTTRPNLVIWVPLRHGGRPIGSISYQLVVTRPVPREELEFLERIHENLGLAVNNAYLNELSRNQAVSLSALNRIARELSVSHDEEGIVQALTVTLSALVPVDRIELVVRREHGPRVKLLECEAGGVPRTSWIPARSPLLKHVRQVLEHGTARLDTNMDPSVMYGSAAVVPIVEAGSTCGALTMRSRHRTAYEQSTLAFFQQVADQVALALRNAWSYSAIESQRRRLEIANAVGRRLGSSLDRWSITRVLREELARHLQFDIFTLATVTEAPDGPTALGYVWDSGEEVAQAPVPITAAGPAREAYESGRPVLLRRARRAGAIEAEARSRLRGDRFLADGMLFDITRPDRRGPVIARSVVWVPVRQGEEVTALLSLQAYRANCFDEWHVQVLLDVAAQVGLALANAEHYRAAQTERNRLAALHRLERGVAGATGELPIAQAFFDTIGGYMDAQLLVLLHFDSRDRVTGYCVERGSDLRCLEPIELERTRYLHRLMEEGRTIAETVPAQLRLPGKGWPTWGPHIPSQLLLVPLFDDNRVVGALSAQRTVEVPFTAEEIQLVESASPVISVALRSVRLHEAKDLMLRAVGKEVRSPAAVMRATLASLLQWGNVLAGNQRVSLIKEAYEQSERLLNLVENQLLISRMEAGNFEPRPRDVSVRRCMEHVLVILTERFGSRVHNTVDVRLSPELPDAYCEPTHLDQVLANLVGNALEHTPATMVKVTAFVRDDALEVTIADNGGGIPTQHIGNLFSKHGMADRRQHAADGLGLGLYLCQLIVERSFGGRVWLAHSGPSGSTFQFTVPVGPVPACRRDLA